MELYTAQMAKGKVIPSQYNVPVLDVTVKSGDKCFAPTWDFLMAYKNSAKTKADEDEYTTQFIAHMRQSFTNNKEHWREVLSQEKLCILCYCPADKFCHRLILVKLFQKQCQKWGIPFLYIGEIK